MNKTIKGMVLGLIIGVVGTMIINSLVYKSNIGNCQSCGEEFYKFHSKEEVTCDVCTGFWEAEEHYNIPESERGLPIK